MKKLFALLTAIVALIYPMDFSETELPESAVSSPADEAPSSVVLDGKEYFLTFEDNFDGDKLDPMKWQLCPEQRRQDLNNYWSNQMTRLDGEGNLVISMTYDRLNDRFLSGGVRTKGLFEQAYGYYEIRCKVNTVPGYWTAFWLMNDSVVSEAEGGIDGTEIDIMETAYCEQGKVQHTLNWDGYGAAHKALGQVVDAEVYDGEYHTFALLWKRREYVFFIDGKETWRTRGADARTCEVPLYLKITTETGGWTGTPDPRDLPDSMVIDYVRVYG